MVKYTIKYTAAVKQLPTSFARIHPSLSLFSSSSSRSKFGIYRHIFHWQHHASPKTLRGADNTAVYGVISDYFGGGDLEEEDLDVLTLLNELARVIKVQLQTIHITLVLLFIYTIQTSI